MSATVAYLLGFIIITVGVSLGAHYLGVPPKWIAVIAIVMVGLGVTTAITKTRRKEPPMEA